MYGLDNFKKNNEEQTISFTTTIVKLLPLKSDSKTENSKGTKFRNVVIKCGDLPDAIAQIHEGTLRSMLDIDEETLPSIHALDVQDTLQSMLTVVTTKTPTTDDPNAVTTAPRVVDIEGGMAPDNDNAGKSRMFYTILLGNTKTHDAAMFFGADNVASSDTIAVENSPVAATAEDEL